METLDLYNEALNNEGTASIRTAEEIAMYGPGADRDLYPCRLYTSDAADEEDSVERGGRGTS